MQSGARIGHFNVAIHLHRMILEDCALIGRANWITGFPKESNAHFSHRRARNPVLVIGRHSAITKGHHVDCTDRIEIGEFTTIAGYNSQFLSHSIDLLENRQDCHPIRIGNYCFVGTNVVVLGGSNLPDHSVLAAKAVLQKDFSEEWFIYGGVPAKALAPISRQARYFSRNNGFVQ
jgi:acetyltransferase-like isoleucine patch superfamily enzyme